MTPHVVRQRLRLSAVSPLLIEAYRNGEMGFEQLVAFALIDDHARQEAIYDRLTYSRDPVTIRRMLTETNVAAVDRRAVFVGHEAYTEAGGTVLRDLFSEDRGGYFEDVALLDRLAMEKMQSLATTLQKDEGWKWVEANLDFPHGHGLRRVYPREIELSAEDRAAYETAQAEFDVLTKQHERFEELPEAVDARFGELEAEIERIETLRHVYNTDEIASGGAFIVLNHDGGVRVERGFIRPEDDNRKEKVSGRGAPQEDDEESSACADDDNGSEAGLSDSLVADLTAHRTLGLRLALSEQPDVALVAVTHALLAQTFYRGAEASVLDIRPCGLFLGSHADHIEDTEAGRSWSARHARWAAQLPRDVADLWPFVVALDHDSRMAIFAHCAASTINAVKLPRDLRPRGLVTASRLAEAVSLDMTAHWRPTVRTYLGRITKAHIIAAVREAVSDEAAERMADMKKHEMAEVSRAVACRNRVAAYADANAASGARADRAIRCHGGEEPRRLLYCRRVVGMAGTALAVPACSFDTVGIFGRAPSGARQSHANQARDRAHSLESDAFPPEAGRKRRVVACARTCPKGGALPQIMSSRNHDIGSG
ncbi:ParB family chromosome partitioning protein [Bradyrhizobium sp. GM6.1]